MVTPHPHPQVPQQEGLLAPTGLSAGRGNPNTNVARAKRSLVGTSAGTEQGCVRSAGPKRTHGAQIREADQLENAGQHVFPQNRRHSELSPEPQAGDALSTPFLGEESWPGSQH